MKNAGQEIKDEDLAAYMKQSGLGTPATRAAIIEKLVAVGYIERKKKLLLPTNLGFGLTQSYASLCAVNTRGVKFPLNVSLKTIWPDISDGISEITFVVLAVI